MVMSNIASHAISPAVYGRRVRYDPVADFTHVALVVTNPTVWVANPNSGIRTLADAVAKAARLPASMWRPPVPVLRTT